MRRPPLAARDRVADLLKSCAERRLIDMLAEAWTRGLADGAEGAAALAASPASLSGGAEGVPAGMKSWSPDRADYGPDGPPDWDGGPVRLADGENYPGLPHWDVRTPHAYADSRRIIAYTPVTAPSPEAPANRQEAGEVERLRAALEQIAALNQVRHWTATADNPQSHWVTSEGMYAIIARAALTSPKDVKGGGA